ncbi:MAG: C40 family peptidase [Chloroflexi bacterium]|nr:C40 family peptidase [Chloroflexota bacterium]
MRTLTMGARAFIPVALAGAAILISAPSSPAAAAEPRTEAEQIVSIAKQQVGDPYRYGAEGPGSFDCSGLVIYSYTKAGDAKTIGSGRYRSARSMYTYFKSRGLSSTTNPKLGDLVVWGSGSHMGIYVGDGKAVSALVRGVQVHRVHAVTAPFTAYLHTGMWNKAVDGSTIRTTSITPPRIAIGDVRHTTTRVNLRTGPGIDRDRITVLANNTRLVVLRKGQDSQGRWWLKVEAGNRTGWVAKWLTD